MAAISHALIVVGIFAPNSLTVVPAGTTTKNITVPSIGAGDSLFDTAVNTEVYPDDSMEYIAPTPGWISSVQRAVTLPDDISRWQVPLECGIECRYHLKYEAPVLRCSDIPTDNIIGSGPDATANATLPNKALKEDGLNVYFNATSSLGSWLNNVDVTEPWASKDNWGRLFSSNQYSISFAYNLNSSNNSIGGSHCIFYEGEYSASFHFANSTQAVSATINRYDQELTDVPWSYINAAVHTMFLNTSDPTAYANATHRATVEAFAQALIGVASESFNALGVSFYHTNIGSTSLFSITSDPTSLREVWTMTTQNMSESLMNLFTNITLSFNSQSTRQLLNLTSTTTVLASLTPPGSVWQYSATRLWIIYGVSFFVVAICDVIGLICLWSNNIPGDMTFSHIVLASKTLNLDASTIDVSPLTHELTKKAKQTKIRYGVVDDEVVGKRNGFKVVDSDEDEDEK